MILTCRCPNPNGPGSRLSSWRNGYAMPVWKNCERNVGVKSQSYARAKRGCAPFAMRCSNNKFRWRSSRKVIERANIPPTRGSPRFLRLWSTRIRATKLWEYSEKYLDSRMMSWRDLLEVMVTNFKSSGKPVGEELLPTH